MKLGTETNSVVNHLYARGTIGQPDPVVGMGVTFLHWTDRSAGTIIDVQLTGKGTVIRVRGDTAIRVDTAGPYTENQVYRFEPNPHANMLTFRFENGRWQQLTLNHKTGRLNKVKGGCGLRIGERDAYCDPSF